MHAFTFPSADGTHDIAALYSKSEQAKGVIVFHHGMRDHKDRYRAFAKAATARHYDVLIYDAACHGDSIHLPSERGTSRQAPFRQVLLADCQHALYLAQEKSGGLPVFLAGHSLGSFVIRNLIAKPPVPLAGAILLSTGQAPRLLIRLAHFAAQASATLTGIHRRNELTVYFGMWLINTPFIPVQTHFDWISRDRKAIIDFTFDPKCRFTYTNRAFQGIYELIFHSDYFTAKSATDRNLPILFLSGTCDILGAFGYTIPLLVKRAEKNGFRQIESRLYLGARHDLLHEINRETITEDLLNWCDAHCCTKRTIVQRL